MTKQIYVDGFVFLPFHISLPTWSIPNLAIKGENILIYYLFKQNVYAHIRINTHFGKYLEPRKELQRFAWSEPLPKC